MKQIVIIGIGTNVGKTVTAAILTHMLQGIYWKPVESGRPSDTEIVKKLLKDSNCSILKSAYSLQRSIAPSFAAKEEGVVIAENKLIIPASNAPLIIETAGGIYTPITDDLCTLDVIKMWKLPCLLVTRHYLGSINHTLLTTRALKAAEINCLGMIVNGTPDELCEKFLEEKSQLQVMARIENESKISPKIIQKYSSKWHTIFYNR